MKNIAIITAAGSGTRISSYKKKQFIDINHRPLLFWTIDKFVYHSEINQVIIVLPECDISKFKDKILKEYTKAKIEVIEGGDKRQESVKNALEVCPVDTNIVLIHDGVRPFVTQKEITSLIAEAQIKKAVIPVYKVKNTIKKIQNNKIIKTVSRDDLVNALTPQVFSFQLIKEYHQKAKNIKIEFTDDASLLEYFDHTVYTLECSSNNFKITDQTDLEIAKHIIENKLFRRE